LIFNQKWWFHLINQNTQAHSLHRSPWTRRIRREDLDRTHDYPIEKNPNIVETDFQIAHLEHHTAGIDHRLRNVNIARPGLTEATTHDTIHTLDQNRDTEVTHEQGLSIHTEIHIDHPPRKNSTDLRRKQ